MTFKPYTVKTLIDHPAVTIISAERHPGHQTPRHSHEHDYVVHPHQDTTLVKTTYKDGTVIKTEDVTHTAGVPYVVAKSVDGTEFTIKNIGSAAMMCDKTLLPPKG